MTMELNGDISFEVPELEGEIREMEPVEWVDILHKPTEFPPSAHTQGMDTINGLAAKFAETFAAIEEKVDAEYVSSVVQIVSDNLDTETEARIAGDYNLQQLIAIINALIPTQATPQNQLGDKNFINSSIATNTAYYISKIVEGERVPFDSLTELEAYTGPVTNNDYAFVKGVDSGGNTTYTRYKYNSNDEAWAKEYVLNNSSFTADQWAAINSGITAGTLQQILSDISTLKIDMTTAKEDISQLESDKVGFTDFANSNKTGVVKTPYSYAVETDSTGAIRAAGRTLSQYNSGGSNMFIGKLTLENLINGGHITNQQYVDNKTQSVDAEAVSVTEETWTFTLTDGTTVNKKVMVL